MKACPNLNIVIATTAMAKSQNQSGESHQSQNQSGESHQYVERKGDSKMQMKIDRQFETKVKLSKNGIKTVENDWLEIVDCVKPNLIDGEPDFVHPNIHITRNYVEQIKSLGDIKMESVKEHKVKMEFFNYPEDSRTVSVDIKDIMDDQDLANAGLDKEKSVMHGSTDKVNDPNKFVSLGGAVQTEIAQVPVKEAVTIAMVENLLLIQNPGQMHLDDLRPETDIARQDNLVQRPEDKQQEWVVKAKTGSNQDSGIGHGYQNAVVKELVSVVKSEAFIRIGERRSHEQSGPTLESAIKKPVSRTDEKTGTEKRRKKSSSILDETPIKGDEKAKNKIEEVLTVDTLEVVIEKTCE